MYNLSLSLLSITGNFHSPFFAKNNRLDISKSIFSKFAYHALFQTYNLNVSKTKFYQFTNTAIFVSRSSYDELIFTTPQTFPLDTSYLDLYDCSFLNCYSPIMAGAVYVARDVEVWIEDTFFYRCSSGTQCGAISLRTFDERAYTYYVCVEECFAADMYHYGLKQSEYRSYENFTTVFHCGGPNSTSDSVIFQNGPGKVCYSNDNYSFNNVIDSGLSISGIGCLSTSSSDYSYYLKYLNIEHNQNGAMIYLNHPTSYSFYAYDISFFNNSLTHSPLPLFHVRKYSITFEDVFMIGNVGILFFTPMDASTYNIRYTLEDCYIDITNPMYSYISIDDVTWNLVGRTVYDNYLLSTRNCLSRYSGLSPDMIIVIVFLSIFGGIFALAVIGVVVQQVNSDSGSCSCSCQGSRIHGDDYSGQYPEQNDSYQANYYNNYNDDLNYNNNNYNPDNYNGYNNPTTNNEYNNNDYNAANEKIDAYNQSNIHDNDTYPTPEDNYNPNNDNNPDPINPYDDDPLYDN